MNIPRIIIDGQMNIPRIIIPKRALVNCPWAKRIIIKLRTSMSLELATCYVSVHNKQRERLM